MKDVLGLVEDIGYVLIVVLLLLKFVFDLPNAPTVLIDQVLLRLLEGVVTPQDLQG